MASREMTKAEIDGWEKLYAKDLAVIGGFLDFLKMSPARNFRLTFQDGARIIATFSGAADSDNGLEMDDPYYEEYYELDFIVKKIEKQGSGEEYRENEIIYLNFRNFFVKFEPYDGDDVDRKTLKDLYGGRHK